MSRSGLALTIGFAAEAVRESAPLVHCVAPRAATAFVADVLHGAGARSVVTGTSPDALAAALTADAVVLDLGTLSSEWSDAVNPSIARARSEGLPWVLDVTSLGRAPLRLDRIRALLGHRPSVVRTSLQEVDGMRIDVPEGALVLGESAERAIVGTQEVAIPHGSTMLAQIPGVRSAVSALVGACTVVTGPLEAALAGCAWLAVASERAEERGLGPASFRTALIDALWTVRGDEIAQYLDLN